MVRRVIMQLMVRTDKFPLSYGFCALGKLEQV